MSARSENDMMIQDRIERTLLLPVAQERAWRAITDPAEINRWFGGDPVLDLRPGGELRFTWSGGTRCRVATVKPPHRFAYWWHPGSEQHHDVPFDDQPQTLVEFILDEAPGGTRLTLIESGFAALPAETYDRIWQENTEGWDEELGHLSDYLAADAKVA